MTSNAFDMVRKVRHLHGLKLTDTIEPQYISKRVKNAAQKMLRTGILTSGYRSQARMLADQLLGDAGISPAASANSWAVRIFSPTLLTEDARARIGELVEASRVIEIANLSAGRDDKYLNERYKLMLEEFQQSRVQPYAFRLYNASIQAHSGDWAD
jgi:hypothetical protein